MFHADGRSLSILQLRRDFVSSIMTGREKEKKWAALARQQRAPPSVGFSLPARSQPTSGGQRIGSEGQ